MAVWRIWRRNVRGREIEEDGVINYLRLASVHLLDVRPLWAPAKDPVTDPRQAILPFLEE